MNRWIVLLAVAALLGAGCETVKESVNGAGRTIDQTIGGDR